MISLILPYWERPEATNRSLSLLAEHYADLDMEVIIVDDGSAEAYKAPDMPFLVFTARLRQKKEPKNPCEPINVGVSYAHGNVIALSSPEILHTKPVLGDLAESLDSADYVAAACWCEEQGMWHAHSSRTPLMADRTDIEMPAGAQYHFLAVLKREMFDKSGGFDPEYREGHAYDDNDFLMRLGRAGARFLCRDDLVVQHPRKGTRSAWKPELIERNRKLFISKWA